MLKLEFLIDQIMEMIKYRVLFNLNATRFMDFGWSSILNYVKFFVEKCYISRKSYALISTFQLASSLGKFMMSLG